MTVQRGIPVTTVARTLVDLAKVLPAPQLERAVAQAEVLRLLDMRSIDEVLARDGRRRGAPALRAVLSLEPQVTRSELEQRFLVLCRRAGLPVPRVNALVWVGPGQALEVDFLWERPRVVVETDGRAFHDTASGFATDRRRDAALTTAGYRVHRFSWTQVARHPAEVIRTLRVLLGC